MILFLHTRYRTTGGEERAVQDLLWLVREHLGEGAELLARDSAATSPARAAAGLLGGGLAAAEVARAVRLSRARVVHAHNLLPAFGWRALAAARASGARVVLHLHQYRLVCATGVCFTGGADCTRCHGRNTLPGILHNCRASLPEAVVYGASLALWQRRLVAHADEIVVPSSFARSRLEQLGAPLGRARVHVLAPPLRDASDSVETGAGEPAAGEPDAGARGAPSELPAGPYALVVSRLAAEKGVDVAIEACRIASLPLVIAGAGPQEGALRRRASGADVRFVGRAGERELRRLRAGAAIALVPSRAAETFGLAAAEAMAAGLPVAASRVGALPELVGEEGLVAAGDAAALACAIERLAGDRTAGERARERALAVCSPHAAARSLARIYDGGVPVSA